MSRFINPAIFFDAEGYSIDGPRLMGRQAAGNAFLRAAVAAAAQQEAAQPLYVCAPKRESAQLFANLVRQIDSRCKAEWVPADRVDLLAQVGTLYLPGPGLDAMARLRLHAGPAAYSVVGVTHTTASHRAMDAITGMLSAPVMPWDALICTSSAVAATVQVLLDAELEHLRWRFGSQLQATLPQLPVIPLGVHCADFELSETDRSAARQTLQIAADEIVVLYVGRLSFHAKAHPHAMYAGLQAAAKSSGKKITLIQCGWFGNKAIDASFADGAAQFCPEVRSLFIDGRDPALRRQCWAAADLFVSLSDNIQETFGLTPIEAMAAGLPVLVSDWDGYKDTVRDGIDGYRIPTWMPPAGTGADLARRYEAGIDTYDLYCGLTCQTAVLDWRALVERLLALVTDPALRQRMGAAGKARARQLFDWTVVYRQYQSLWGDLGRMREQAHVDPMQQGYLRGAPSLAPARGDPYSCFAHYPSATIAPTTLVDLRPDASLASYRQLIEHGLFNYAAMVLPSLEVVEQLLVGLGERQLSVAALADLLQLELDDAMRLFATSAKMGLVTLSHPQPAQDQI